MDNFEDETVLQSLIAISRSLSADELKQIVFLCCDPPEDNTEWNLDLVEWGISTSREENYWICGACRVLKSRDKDHMNSALDLFITLHQRTGQPYESAGFLKLIKTLLESIKRYDLALKLHPFLSRRNTPIGSRVNTPGVSPTPSRRSSSATQYGVQADESWRDIVREELCRAVRAQNSTVAEQADDSSGPFQVKSTEPFVYSAPGSPSIGSRQNLVPRTKSERFCPFCAGEYKKDNWEEGLHASRRIWTSPADLASDEQVADSGSTGREGESSVETDGPLQQPNINYSDAQDDHSIMSDDMGVTKILDSEFSTNEGGRMDHFSHSSISQISSERRSVKSDAGTDGEQNKTFDSSDFKRFIAPAFSRISHLKDSAPAECVCGKNDLRKFAPRRRRTQSCQPTIDVVSKAIRSSTISAFSDPRRRRKNSAPQKRPGMHFSDHTGRYQMEENFQRQRSSGSDSVFEKECRLGEGSPHPTRRNSDTPHHPRKLDLDLKQAEKRTLAEAIPKAGIIFFVFVFLMPTMKGVVYVYDNYIQPPASVKRDHTDTPILTQKELFGRPVLYGVTRPDSTRHPDPSLHIENVRMCVSKHQRCLVKGFFGEGKSQALSFYVHQSIGQYPGGIIWLRSWKDIVPAAGVVAVYHGVDITIRPETAPTFLQDFLRSTSGWLLVIQDEHLWPADDFRMVLNLFLNLESTENHVIITSHRIPKILHDSIKVYEFNSGLDVEHCNNMLNEIFNNSISLTDEEKRRLLPIWQVTSCNHYSVQRLTNFINQWNFKLESFIDYWERGTKMEWLEILGFGPQSDALLAEIRILRDLKNKNPEVINFILDYIKTGDVRYDIPNCDLHDRYQGESLVFILTELKELSLADVKVDNDNKLCSIQMPAILRLVIEVTFLLKEKRVARMIDMD